MKRIKFLIYVLVVSTVLFAGCSSSGKFGKLNASDISGLIHNKDFTFIANTMDPLRGVQKSLNSYYDLSVSGDTLRSYLPYYGRIYSPLFYPDEGPIQFTSNDFTYAVKKTAKSWNITIVPEDHRYIQAMYFTVFENGNTILNVVGVNRDPITYGGYLQKVG